MGMKKGNRISKIHLENNIYEDLLRVKLT